jgi:LysM repeat protein
MQRTGVPASITLAQGIHETTAGTSELVMKSNNHFGIKCKSNWTGESVSHDDDARGECFRKYNDPADSYKDHSDFLRNGQRYSFLFSLDPLNYKGWATGLKKAGYATNPRYPQVLIKLIEDYDLQDYSLLAMGRLTKEEWLAKNPDASNSDRVPAVSAVATSESQAKVVNAVVTEEVERPDYPFGEFKINETRVIYAEKGTSFLSIAEQYKVPLARLFEFNDMKQTETVEKGQLVYLQPKRKTGKNDTHIVKEGETLQDIAREEAIRLTSLLEYNYLNGQGSPAVGTRLYLRKKAPALVRE